MYVGKYTHNLPSCVCIKVCKECQYQHFETSKSPVVLSELLHSDLLIQISVLKIRNEIIFSFQYSLNNSKARVTYALLATSSSPFNLRKHSFYKKTNNNKITKQKQRKSPYLEQLVQFLLTWQFPAYQMQSNDISLENW